jgi:hypothetical protein
MRKKVTNSIYRWKLIMATSKDYKVVEETVMKIIYRQIKEEDKEAINDLYEKLLDNHGASVGMGHRIWMLVLE